MINMEIPQDFSLSNDQTVVKGKRTKRLRPSSSTSSIAGGDFNYSLVSSSPATSTSTEEDEDMANCLILLARGGYSSQTEDELEINRGDSKFSSRKFTEMIKTTNGKVGIYVYECKTCSRTFPSFQALGGHRASHKKPKTISNDVDQKLSLPEEREEKEVDVKFSKINTIVSIPPSMNKNCHKVHECSICGAEFASGQALGGHMRRHRSVSNSLSTNTRSANGSSSSQDNGEKTRNVLSLDLNLPAPAEDDCTETKFHQFSSKQQPPIVFSAPALVDCHY